MRRSKVMILFSDQKSCVPTSCLHTQRLKFAAERLHLEGYLRLVSFSVEPTGPNQQ